MPSRLSSLLVRDGLVGVKRMEKAFQRQVIYGGSLDTILLEMNLVPEERLTQYLALASGLPPAAPGEADAIEPAATALISAEISEQFRAIPLTVAGEALRVLVCSPLELTELEDLADLLDRPLQPLITPEYRWHLAFATAYGGDAPARFTTLSRQLEQESSPLPVGRSRTVIVELPNSAAGVVEAVEAPDATAPLVAAPPEVLPPLGYVPNATPTASPIVEPVEADEHTQPMAMPLEPAATRAPVVVPVAGERSEGRSRSTTIVGVAPGYDGSEATEAPRPAPPRRPNDGVPDESAYRPRVTFTPASGVPRRLDDAAARRAAKSAPIDTSGRDSPLAIAPARELLATAEDRDSVFLTLLRAARARARYAALLTVQGGAAIGRVALAEPGLDAGAVQKVLIPLDAVSPVRAVVTSQQPHVGTLVSGDPSVDSMMLRLGGTMPPSALIMPIVLRERVVALVIAHRVHSDLRLLDVTELLPLAGAAADALGRLIVRHKSAGYRAPSSAAPELPIDGAQVETKRTVRPEGEWRVPAAATPPAVPHEVELSVVAEPPRPMEELLDEIEAAKEGEAEEAIADAIERASEAIAGLVQRFPGKLRIDRFAATGRTLRAAQYGGLLELVVRLGSFSSELLIDQMSSAQRDVRFFATLCAAELRPRNAVYALVERVFDQDFGIRECAIEALAGYPIADLTPALARARRAVHTEDPEVVGAATTALVALGDIEAVPELIGALERTDRAGETVRKALVALTAQDYGANERKWRKWYDAARRRHRVEWLIDGLSHKEGAIREASISALRRLTGEYFSYHHDLPRREREAAAERWHAWWRETGQRRFTARPEDERHRPTAVLPVRRD
jgi:hypothetical protein